MSDPKELRRWAEIRQEPRNALVQIPTDTPEPSELELEDFRPPAPTPPTHKQVMAAPSHNPIGKAASRFSGPKPNAMVRPGKAPAKGSKAAKAKAWARSRGKAKRSVAEN